MRLLLLLILGGSLATAHPSYAQSVLVTGTVTSSTDNGSLPGVNVVEKGTTNGTITDIDGRYSLTIPPEGILVFSSIGYLSQEVEVGNQTVIDVSLENKKYRIECLT